MKRKLKCLVKLCAAIWQDFGHLKIGSSTHNWMYLRKKNFYDSCTWYKPLGMNVANFNKIVFGAIFTVCFGCRSRIVVYWAANVCSNGKDTVWKSIWNENEITCKGQFISKAPSRARGFAQKANERIRFFCLTAFCVAKRRSNTKSEFVRSFFGRKWRHLKTFWN